MVSLTALRGKKLHILSIGSHRPIIQSMLDFDYLTGKDEPSVKAIVATGRHYERYFFGKKEVLIPVFNAIDKIPNTIKATITLFFNTSSARRAKQTTMEVIDQIPGILGGTIFAEDIPEAHSLDIYHYLHKKEAFVVGPASVGLLIPGCIKLGAIGGTDYRQLIASNVLTEGDIAVFSASGGMVGEIIRIVAEHNFRLSFALSFGGDRFPIFSPKDAFLTAQNDPQTKAIIYYGELGGDDEYALASLLATKQVTKPVICYIAGTVAELFVSPPQFGHAKAIATSQGESAREKRDALRKAGALVAESFTQFVDTINNLPKIARVNTHPTKEHYLKEMDTMNNRKQALITSTISGDMNDDITIMGENILSFTTNRTFAAIVGSMFLGKKTISKELEVFIDFVIRLAVDHGPYVSGAVNTIITARAGRDLVSSLSAGLLTIGPRFGGATNDAAKNWYKGVTENKSPFDFVENFARNKQYIAGIGHRKYRIDAPDPRVVALLMHSEQLNEKRFSLFALEVQTITTAKKGNLILNVDGAIAAVLLDILAEKENVPDEQLEELTNIEFFNALFVLSRSVGFISHFLDQKRLDEGMFRLPAELVTNIIREE